MGFGADGYWSPNEILGYSDCKYYIVLSERGIGKSYGFKLWLMKQGCCIMCVYRNMSDMNSAMKDWTDSLCECGWNAEQFEWEGSDKDGWELMVNGSKRVWFRALTMVNHIKQEKFPDNMDWVWFDEFIPLAYKKLSGVDSEGDALRTIVKTIEHDSVRSREEKGLKPLRVMMFANPFTWNNPLLSYFHCVPAYGVRRLGPGVVQEMVEPLEKPEGARMTVDDFLGDAVNRNQSWMDQTAFCGEWPKGLVPTRSVRIGRNFYGVYVDVGHRRYVRRESDHLNCRRLGSLDGLREDETTLDGNVILKTLKNQTANGLLRYRTVNDKFDWLRDIFSL